MTYCTLDTRSGLLCTWRLKVKRGSDEILGPSLLPIPSSAPKSGGSFQFLPSSFWSTPDTAVEEEESPLQGRQTLIFKNIEWRMSVIFLFSFWGVSWPLSVGCSPINLGGIISATGRLAQKLTWGNSFILLKLQDTLYGLSQERAEEKWACCWEEIRGLQACEGFIRGGRSMEQWPLDTISSIHSTYLFTTGCHGTRPYARYCGARG